MPPGDTLGGIAKALGVRLKALLDANSLADPDRLTVGQKLAVPAVALARPGSAWAPPARTRRGEVPPAPRRRAPTAPAQQPQPATDEASATLDSWRSSTASIRRWCGRSPGSTRMASRASRIRTAGVGHLTVTDKTFEYIQQSLVKRTLDRAVPGDNLEAGIAYVAAMLKWGGEEPKGLAGFLQGPGSVRANGVRPAIEEQVKRILALRDRLKQGLPAQTTAGPATSLRTALAPTAAGAGR